MRRIADHLELCGNEPDGPSFAESEIMRATVRTLSRLAERAARLVIHADGVGMRWLSLWAHRTSSRSIVPRVVACLALGMFVGACGGESRERARATVAASATAQVPANAPPSEFRGALETNGYATCAVRARGALYCWGSMQIDLPAGASALPFAVPGITDATQVSLSRDSDGSWAYCLLRKNGAVACWGDNHHGQVDPTALGEERRSPTPVAGIPRAREVRILGDAACIVTDAQKITCWGDETAPAPYEVPDLSGVAHISTRGACVILAGGSVRCAKQPLGTKSRVQWRPIGHVTKASRVIDLDPYHCAIIEGGDPLCWNDGVEASAATPIALPALATAIDIHGRSVEDSPGEATRIEACFLRRNGSVACTNDARQTSGITEFPALGAAIDFTDDQTTLCSLHADGEVLCSGRRSAIPVDFHGVVDHPEPRAVKDLEGVVEIQAAGKFTCAREGNGRVSCWGTDIPDKHGVFHAPDALDVTDVVALGVDRRSICVTTRVGKVICQGHSPGGLRHGPVGSDGGRYPFDHKPLALPGLTRFFLDEYEACGVTKEGVAHCWRGDPRFVTREVASGVREAVALDKRRCVVSERSRVTCQEGENGTPADVPAFAGITWITPGEPHTVLRSGPNAVDGWHTLETDDWLALEANGKVALLSFGSVSSSFHKISAAPNAAVEVAMDDRYAPALEPVAGITDARSIASGPEHACAVRSNGHVSCWGTNRDGDLGDGGYADHGPQDVIGIENATAVACGTEHSCALLASGKVMCWGTALDGALGTGEQITDYGAEGVKVVFPDE
jgi:alpha-tubulin suppressor-like RCC1 family protein